ncbi:5905_t:CDS:2, partial [Racocetra fulgida]
MCNDCLYEVLERESDYWSSGNLQIDEFIRKAQRLLYQIAEFIRKAQRSLYYNRYPERISYNFYIRYPEWIPYNSLTKVNIGRGEFGAVLSAEWSQGAKKLQISNNKHYYIRSGPCAVVLKKLKDMKQLSIIEVRFQDLLYCCNIYGITQDPSTSEYMLVEPTSLCDNCHRKVLIGEFSNWSSGCLLIDEFIRKAQQSLPYDQYPEWIPYDSFTEIKPIFLKKLKDANQLSMIEIRYQDLLYCCNIYGITQNPSTSEYILVEPSSLCDNCLHETLKCEFSKWPSGCLPIDEFIRKAQQSLSYDRYPEWIPYDSFTEIKPIFLKKLKDMNQLSMIEIRHQDSFYCCDLYGITQDPSTSEYMLVEPTSLCDNCLHKALESELIDEFIRKAQLKLRYNRYPEWIPYNYFTKIKHIRGEFGAVFSAEWSKRAKKIQRFNNDLYGITQDPSTLEYMLVEPSSLCNDSQQSLPYDRYPEWIPYDSFIEIKYINRGELGELQDQSDCCLYGITQNPSTLEYMFVEPTYLCDSCLHRELVSEFPNWS